MREVITLVPYVYVRFIQKLTGEILTDSLLDNLYLPYN